jgi:hypothetical protein
MADPTDSNRNPTILPDKKGPTKRGCPKCGHPDFLGFVAQGCPTYRCLNKECDNVWQGGMIHEQGDPRVPYPPPSSAPPSLIFDKALVRGGGNNGQYITPEIVEVRRRPDPTPDFRRGLPFTDDEEI